MTRTQAEQLLWYIERTHRAAAAAALKALSEINHKLARYK
jgi:hypothetical protein